MRHQGTVQRFTGTSPLLLLLLLNAFHPAPLGMPPPHTHTTTPRGAQHSQQNSVPLLLMAHAADPPVATASHNSEELTRQGLGAKVAPPGSCPQPNAPCALLPCAWTRLRRSAALAAAAHPCCRLLCRPHSANETPPRARSHPTPQAGVVGAGSAAEAAAHVQSRPGGAGGLVYQCRLRLAGARHARPKQPQA